MQKLTFLPATLALILAASVTMGSVYVTVRVANSSAQEGEVPAAFDVVDESAVNEDDFNYSVVLGPEGSVSGRIGTIVTPDGRLEDAAGVLVRVLRDGNIYGSATTAADGSYSMTGLTAGDYSVVATSGEVFAAFSFEALNATDNLPNGPMLETAAVSITDITTATSIIREGLGQPGSADSDAEAADGNRNVVGLSYASGISFQSIRIAPDGLVYGWARSLGATQSEITDLTVYFIRDNQTVGAAEVAPDGRFVVGGLTPGNYSVVGIGTEDGMFAVGIELLGPTTAGTETSSGLIPVSGFAAGDFACGIVSTSDVNEENFDDLTGNESNNGREDADGADRGGLGNDSTLADARQPGSQPFGGPPAPGGYPGTGGVPVGGGGAPGVGGGDGLLPALVIGAAIWGIYEATNDDKSPASGSN